MANTFAPFGLQPFGRREGGAPTAGLTKYLIASSDSNPVFCGDTVHISTVSNKYITWDSTGSNATNVVIGVFMGCEYYSPSVQRVVWSRYFPGSVATSSGTADVTAYVIDDTEQLFIVQASTGTVLGTSLNGLNFQVIPSSQGVTLDGHSVLTLNASGTVGGSTNTPAYPFRLVDTYASYAPPGANGTDTTAAGAIWVVAPNAWANKLLTTHST